MPSACPACGAVNPDDSRFCQSCGTDLTVPPAPAVPPSGPVATQPTQAAPSYPPFQATQPVQPPQPVQPTQPNQPVPPTQPLGGGPAYPPVPPPGSGPAWPAAAWGSPAGGPPAGGPPGPGVPPGGAGPPGKRGPGFRTIAIGVGGALVLAVVAGLVVPKLFSHHKAQAATVVTKTRGHTTTSTTLPTAPATTQAPTPTTVASTPTTATPTTAAPTTAPGTSGSSGTSGTTGTSGNSGTTGTSGSGGGNGRTVHNPQVEVTLSPGWSVNSKSSSTLLILNGPNSTSAGFHSEAALPATTLESAVAALESSTEQLGTGAKVCIPAQPTTIPGRIPGADFGICLTTTPQGAAANPIEVVDFVALKQVGTGRRLYVVELVFPQAISSASFKADYGPLLNSVQWATT